MESLIAVVVLLVVLALVIAVLVLPVLLVVHVLRASAVPRGSVRPEDWTDDDEIAARHHH